MFGVQQGKAVDQAPRLRSRAPLRCVDDCPPTLTVLAHAGDVTPTRVARPREGSVRPKAKGRSDRKDSRPLYGLPRQQTSGLLLPMERVAQRSGEEAMWRCCRAPVDLALGEDAAAWARSRRMPGSA